MIKKIILPDSDIEILALCDVQTYRARGSGGQHVNKTDSAVRLIYRPNGLTVTCQQERSQHLNKLLCIKKLREKVDRLNYRPPKRIPTKTPKKAKEQRLQKKAKHATKKQLRQKLSAND